METVNPGKAEYLAHAHVVFIQLFISSCCKWDSFWFRTYLPHVLLAQLAAICKFNKQILFWSLMKILNITRLWTYPCRNPTGMSLHVDSETLVTTFWVLFSNKLYSHFVVRSSRPYFLSLPVGMFGEKVPENLLRSGYMTKLFLCCPQDPLPFTEEN